MTNRKRAYVADGMFCNFWYYDCKFYYGRGSDYENGIGDYERFRQTRKMLSPDDFHGNNGRNSTHIQSRLQ